MQQLPNADFYQFFPINRGCRQGDPVSSYIFILSAEILSIMIKGNENIKGINIKKHTVSYLSICR